MKLLQTASVAALVLCLARVCMRFSGLRTGAFGRSPESYREGGVFVVAAELQLQHERAIHGELWRYGGYGYGRGGDVVAGLSEGGPAVSDCAEAADADTGTGDRAGGDLDSDDIFNYPWVYAVMVHTWSFNDEEAKRMREYLLKGGFLMVDDFHGSEDWENFMNGMRQVFPDRNPVEDLTDKDEIFHVLYDMDDRFQVPGEQYIRTGRTYEKDGYVPKWRAIRDDKGGSWWRSASTCTWVTRGSGRMIRTYPETFASMAFREGLNYVVYGMTH